MLATSLRHWSGSAAADDTPGFIRDAEIENIIRTWWTPIILAAGLDPQAVHIYLVNDPTLNSFVAGGQNLFLNTGTLAAQRKPQPDRRHHGPRDRPHRRRASVAQRAGDARTPPSRASSPWRPAPRSAVVGHSPDAGAAAVLGGAGVSERSFLSFSVTQEASADHAAMTFLDRAHLSARGLLEFFGILEKEEMLAGQREDPYLRTHPLTRDRINYVRDHVEHSQWSNVPDPPDWIAMHKLMKAKLAAFLDAPSQTLAAYKEDDNSVPARYARAIAYYRIPQLKNALELIDGLIKDAPNDPYFQELKGQMLFENGRVKDAIAPYERAVALKPDSALLRIELAQVELESDDASQVPKALAFLNGATPFEGDNADLWRLLAIAYGRSGNMGMAALSLAEQGMADGDFNAARQEAARAIKLLPPGAQRQRAQDIADDARRSRDRGG